MRQPSRVEVSERNRRMPSPDRRLNAPDFTPLYRLTTAILTFKIGTVELATIWPSYLAGAGVVTGLPFSIT
jgi:hypothetical protein